MVWNCVFLSISFYEAIFFLQPKWLIGSLILVIIAVVINLLFPQPVLIKLLSPLICSGAVYCQDSNEPVIALTIDDSPDPQTTSQILAVLAKYSVNATFFPISDRVQANPELTQAIVRAGHEIGNHLTRDEPSIKLGEKFPTELDKAHQVLSQYAPIKWLRPGSGWCNRSMVKTAQAYNYQVALGSVWSYDTHIKSSKFASWFILTNARAGSIIVLHDGEKRGVNTVQTLQTIIPQLRQRGYRFVTLSDLKNY